MTPPLPVRLRSWVRSVRPRRADLRSDLVAGLAGAIPSVPDGMASASLVGVNPAYGLYASVAGPVGGGLTSSTRMMVVTTTTAASLAAGSALASVPADQRDHQRGRKRRQRSKARRVQGDAAEDAVQHENRERR